MFLSAFRRRADEDELADQPYVLGGDLLSDAAAKRKAQQVDFREAEQIDESDCIFRHRCDIIRRLASRATNTRVVKRDDWAIGRESVDDGGIPSVYVAREVLQENQRRSGCGAEAAIGKADAVAFGKLFIANPDLPQRMRLRAALNEPDQPGFYAGGAQGYTDYPSL